VTFALGPGSIKPSGGIAFRIGTADVVKEAVLAAISIGQILAVLVTLNLIGLCILAFVVSRRK
jgi:hypothetical protein